MIFSLYYMGENWGEIFLTVQQSCLFLGACGAVGAKSYLSLVSVSVTGETIHLLPSYSGNHEFLFLPVLIRWADNFWVFFLGDLKIYLSSVSLPSFMLGIGTANHG